MPGSGNTSFLGSFCDGIYILPRAMFFDTKALFLKEYGTAELENAMHD